MSAGSVVLTGPADQIAQHPHLMDVFFGVTHPHAQAPGKQRG
jgi:hypothetical protein